MHGHGHCASLCIPLAHTYGWCAAGLNEMPAHSRPVFGAVAPEGLEYLACFRPVR